LEKKEKPNSNRKGTNKVIKQTDITLRKNTAGAWVASAIVDGYLETRQFYYYTKREAARRFVNEVNGKKEVTK
jgi:hypothetical protein